MPRLTMTDLAGNKVSFDSFRGKPLLLDFWASYCGPCKRATALSEELSQAYGRDGLAVRAVTQDTPADARSWMAFNHLSLPVLLDADGVASRAFEVDGVPVAILVDAQGRVVKYWVGFDDEADVRSTVEALLHSATKERRGKRPRGQVRR